MLHGRDGERERLAALVRGAADGRSFATLIEGPAGIGKTSLLDDVVSGADGMLVLRATGYEAEIGIPYAGLSALLGPVIGLRDRLPDAQRLALGGALALEVAPPQDRFAVPVATLGLLGAIAEEQPVLVVVDDVHWLDAATVDAIVFAAQRLAAEGVGVLLASRDAAGRQIDAPGLDRLMLGPLGRDAALAVLGDGPPLGTEARDLVVAAGAGNPLALRELPRLLTPDQRAGRAPLEGPPAAGDEMQPAFAGEIRALPPETVTALVVVAAGIGSLQAAVGEALVRIGVGVDALDPAITAGVLVDDRGRWTFRHPLLGSAAYHAAPSGEQRAAHAALAATIVHPSRRAWHLAAAAVGPDAAASQALRAAGEEARAQAAHADAARAFGRAAELAVDAAERAALALEAASEHALAGHGEQAFELVGRASESDVPAVRDGARRLRAHLLMRSGSPAEAIDALETLSSAANAAGDRAAAARLLLEASLGHMFTGDMRALLELASRAREQATGVADDLVMLASLVSGEALLALGRSAEGDALVAAAEPLLFTADPRSEIAEVVVMGGMSSLWVERFARVERTIGPMVEIARATGAVGRLVYPLSVRAQLEWRCGRWAAAYADAEECVRLARDTGQAGVLALALAILARAEAGTGRIDAARATGREAVALAETAAGDATVLHGLAALGFAELSAGRADLAVAPLERADALQRRLGHGEPALTMYVADLIEALVRTGRRDDAQQVLSRLEDDAGQTGGAWAHAVVERGRLLLADEGAIERHAEAAFACHDRVDMPFERARTALVFGERLRRARRRADARRWLEDARRTFERLGADPWAARARTELRATGGHAVAPAASPVEELTPHELQVALLVAEGRTNREVGAALFLSPKTIEHHLLAIYRKLGLRSRTQLAVLLADQLPGHEATASV